MCNHGAGLPKDPGEHFFEPPAIPDVSCNFSVIPEMCFHKGQDRPNPLVVGGKKGASEGKEVEINLSGCLR
jgi:hypothetical protein